MGGNQTLIKTDISCLMIEKTPIVRQVGQIAKYAPLWAAHTISQMRQCRGAASSKGRSRRDGWASFAPLHRQFR